jgi:UDP-glucose 4-epimerase
VDYTRLRIHIWIIYGCLNCNLILKKILVTGGNGFIGSKVVNKLLSETDISIVLLSNSRNVNEKSLKVKQRQENLPLTFYTLDIRDKKAVLDLFNKEKPDTCVHLAAKISVADSKRNPNETMEINVEGTVNVLEACYKNDVKNFVFASSAAVYGDIAELPIKENSSLEPQSPYGSSKMLAEEHIMSYKLAKKIENAIMLRIFNVYGIGQESETDVISRFAGRLSKGLPPIIYGDGSQTRDFISVNDVADAFLLSVKAIDSNSYDEELELLPIFNIGTGVPTSITQIAQKMIQILGTKLEPIHEELTDDTAGILHSYADMRRAKKTLNFVPKQDIFNGLKEVVERGKP